MDVGGWLRNLGLGHYEANFRDNKIDVDVLADLTDGDLEKLGLPLGDRKRLLKAIPDLVGLHSATRISEPVRTRPPSAAAQSISAERRPITVMFCDLVGSTSLAAKLDAEDWRNLVGSYLDEASAAVNGLGGHVLKKLGDGLMALFGYPHAQENDAERAVRAALAIQRALVEINARNASKGAPELSARIGLDSGQVVVDSTGEVFGDAPNIAARVQGAAEPGSILITAPVQRQTAGLFVAEDRGQHELKGVSAPMTLYRIVRASGGGRRGGVRVLTPLVGREEELDLLGRRWERARKGEGQLALVVGEPGLGKSRLMEEFHGRLGETPHTWVEWSSSQLLQNTPLHPIAEWGRQRFGADLPPEQRLADLENTLGLIGLDPTEYAALLAPLVDVLLPEDRVAKLAPEELRRRQLAAMTTWVLASARIQAVVLAFEDLQWADPTSLDLMRALAERGAQAPLLIIATARPEFRPPWSVRSHHSVISLSPLDSVQIAKMVRELSSRHALPKDIVEGVSERTGGVPLFVEEVTRLLLERGEQGGAQAIPPTLQQSLAARLDRLGSARETAQIGAVVGRGFSYALLQSVAGLGEGALRSSLERLAEADILFVEGDGAQATYRFKHALIQDAAYDSLLKSRRQALHRRAAEALRDGNAEPEAIAHHFTQAGLDDPAIEWWGKAGDAALRRSAFQEAIAHLGKAIAMADKAQEARSIPAVAGVNASRVKLQSDYAQAVLWSKGWGADETKAAFERTGDFAVRAERPTERFPALYGQALWNLLRGDIYAGQDVAERFLREAAAEGEVAEVGVAHRVLGLACILRGDLTDARSNLELALGSYVEGRDSEIRQKFAQDTGVVSRSFLAWASWLLGDLQRAYQLIEEATQLASDLGHIPSAMTTLFIKSLISCFRNDASCVAVEAQVLSKISHEHGVKTYIAYSDCFLGWAEGRLSDARLGAEELGKSLAEYGGQGDRLFKPLFQGHLAELEAAAGEAERALTTIGEGLATAQDGGQHVWDAFLHCIRGDILLKADSEHPARAEDAYLAAVAIAREQGARSFELRAALALARLHQSTGHPADAHAVLAPATEGFSPTPEMPEIAEALALLTALAATDEVRAQVAQRHRLSQLQVSYGNALIAARGHTAPETTEAFAKVREFGAGGADFRELAAADYGLWVASYGRGELPPMRVHSAAFLEDVAARPDSVEACVAHRVAGSTHWFAGEYREAREHLERAVALFQPGRDDDVAFRFGQDAGVAATLFLAIVLWVLGDVARAIALARQADERLERIPHANTRAYGKLHMALFELIRGEVSRAVPNALELGRVARENDLPLFRALAEFLEAWVKSQTAGSADAREEMSRAMDVLRERNIRCFDGPLKFAHAQEEARLGDPERAISIIDDAMADFDRRGHRAMDAELRRLRGEILLKRDASRSRARRRRLPNRHRRRKTARHAQLRIARGSRRWPNSINRQPAPPTPTPSSRPRLKASHRRLSFRRLVRRMRYSRHSTMRA